MTPRAGRAIALGGVVGAGTRWAVVTAAATPSAFPWPVFALNVVGSFVLGGAMVRSRHRGHTLWRDGVGIGFCGGLTTFSTFAVETARFIQDDRALLAGGYAVASVVAATLAVILGAALVGGAGGIDSVDDPLEAAP